MADGRETSRIPRSPSDQGQDRRPPADQGRDRRPSSDPGRDRRPPADPSRERRSGRAQQRRRQNSVFRYIAILFAAAFVLLLFTFMMERRQSKQQIDDLKQSASAVQTLQGLMTSNEELKDQVEDLQSQAAELQQKINQLEQEKAAVQQETAEQEKSVQALDWFWQINEAYVRGKYSLCRKLIQSLEEANLQDTLPKVSITNNERFSPYDRYMEIRGRVVK